MFVRRLLPVVRPGRIFEPPSSTFNTFHRRHVSTSHKASSTEEFQKVKDNGRRSQEDARTDHERRIRALEEQLRETRESLDQLKRQKTRPAASIIISSSGSSSTSDSQPPEMPTRTPPYTLSESILYASDKLFEAMGLEDWRVFTVLAIVGGGLTWLAIARRKRYHTNKVKREIEEYRESLGLSRTRSD